jgi:hypothetical protein
MLLNGWRHVSIKGDILILLKGVTVKDADHLCGMWDCICAMRMCAVSIAVLPKRGSLKHLAGIQPGSLSEATDLRSDLDSEGGMDNRNKYLLSNEDRITCGSEDEMNTSYIK